MDISLIQFLNNVFLFGICYLVFLKILDILYSLRNKISHTLYIIYLLSHMRYLINISYTIYLISQNRYLICMPWHLTIYSGFQISQLVYDI